MSKIIKVHLVFKGAKVDYTVRKLRQWHVYSEISGTQKFETGGTSAAITTPLDVIKTRIMLADRKLAKTPGALKVTTMMHTVYRENGIRGLFAGFVPRVLWITLGGYIFFGMYDFSKHLCNDYLESIQPSGKQL